jgi:uncharacterized cupin superfamily protein
MAAILKKRFDAPDETRSINKGKVEVVKFGNAQAMRVRFEAGWRWSECVKPVAGTDSCQIDHLVYGISGRMMTRMDDGTELEMGPGDVVSIPAGHDAWIIGNEPFVGLDFQGAATYAKQKS